MRRILQQAHKNNVVSVVRGAVATSGTTEAILHSRRQRAAATSAVESSEWSDDESVEPASLLDDGPEEQKRARSIEGDYEANGSVVTTADTEYTTGGDGYTTDDAAATGYTTDDAAATGYTTDDAADDKLAVMAYVTNDDLPVTSVRHLDDNLSTINDTGLTDAEGYNTYIYKFFICTTLVLVFKF